MLADRRVTVRIRLLERCPYTSLIEVSQHPWLDGLGVPSAGAAAHGAHVPRCTFGGSRRVSVRAALPSRVCYPNDEMRQRDEKAQINRFLAEYLSACLYHGVAEDEAVVVGGG